MTGDRSSAVTVLMRSKNAESIIGQALAGLHSQDYADFDLVVVDSGSTDRTLEIVSRYPHELMRIPAADYFPGVVLNRAIAQVRSPIVVFQNSDTVPLVPQSLRHLLSAFDDAAVAAAFGRQLPRPEADPWVRREYAESFPDTGRAPPWITLSLPWAAMRRSAWEQHPFYCDAWASEDTEWGQWALDQGMTVRYVPEAIAMHSHNYTLRQLYSRRFVEGEADVFIYRDRGQRSVGGAVARAARSAARDVATCLRQKAWADVVRVPTRCAVYHYGYWRGHRHGALRLRTGAGTTVGHQTALSGHESNRD